MKSMLKKSLLTATLACVIAGVSPAPAALAVTGDEIVDEIIAAGEATEAAETAEAVEATETAAPAPAGNAVNMSNPNVVYNDVPSLQESLGFPVLYLPGDLYRSYDPAVLIQGIGGRVADIRFISKHDDTQLMVRTALRRDTGLDDISGFYGYEWKKQRLDDFNNTIIFTCATEKGTYVARWVKEGFAFAIAMNYADQELFDHIVRSFVVSSNKFAHRFAKFTTAAPPEIAKLLNADKK